MLNVRVALAEGPRKCWSCGASGHAALCEGCKARRLCVHGYFGGCDECSNPKRKEKKRAK